MKTPRQECRDVTVTKRKPIKDENRIVGTAVGAVLVACWATRSVVVMVEVATVAGAVGWGLCG